MSWASTSLCRSGGAWSMPDVDGLGLLVRGLVGVVLFAVLFLAARFRFSQRERRRGPADIGLD